MATCRHRCLLVLLLASFLGATAHQDVDENPLLDAARALLENSLASKDGARKDGGGAAEILGQMFSGVQDNVGNFDPSLLTNMVDMFTASKDGDAAAPSAGLNWEGVLGMTGAFLAQQQGQQGQGVEALLNLLPMLMQSSGDQSTGQKADNVLNSVLSLWRVFTQSEMAQSLWKSSGLHKITSRFLDSNGKFDVHRVFESLQNHQFRRTWIRSLTAFLADWLAHIADPTSQARYATMARGILDGTLRSNGLSPFDPTRPGLSISTLVNAMLRRYLGTRADAAPYVRPAVDYLWELLQIGRSKSEGLGLARMSPREIEARMAEALNAEIIEPVLRVWRAFRFAHSRPHCGKFVLCEVAREAQEMPGVGLKPGVSKLASLVATWYLADDAHSSFWTLYASATASTDCQGHFSTGCDEFLHVDREATTKYIHNEL
ncbi:hypothetical protein B566_EDAN016604 [Ephemera danica]|nr:hypothetical protein B566_EDAN016604 [Ephemera danica]